MSQVNKINYFDDVNHLSEVLPLQPEYIYRQIKEWIIDKGESEIESFSNLSRKNREKLNNLLQIKTIEIIGETSSKKSQTKKFLFKTKDGFFFEAVLIEGRNEFYTLCLSSQIGCSLNCSFCATGTMRLKRNLSQGEIVEQFFWLNLKVPGKIKNIVFMGMGEPLLNLKNVQGSIKVLKDFFNFSSRRISVSTSGITKGIDKLIDFPFKINLCISLHSAIQTTRDEIMPDLKKISLVELKKSLLNFQKKTNLNILIEYIMIKEINDDKKHLNALINFLEGLSVKINLIAYNKVAGKSYDASSSTTIEIFSSELIKRGFFTGQRYKKGDDIGAACGQLVLAK